MLIFVDIILKKDVTKNKEQEGAISVIDAAFWDITHVNGKSNECRNKKFC